MPPRTHAAGAAGRKRKPEAFRKLGAAHTIGVRNRKPASVVTSAGDRREAKSDRDARACKRAKRMEIEAAELAGQMRLEQLRRLDGIGWTFLTSSLIGTQRERPLKGRRPSRETSFDPRERWQFTRERCPMARWRCGRREASHIFGRPE